MQPWYIWSGVWRSQPPPPPPQWYGLVRGGAGGGAMGVWSATGWGGGGGGAGVCGEGWGLLELQLKKTARRHRPGQHSTQALRKP